MRDKQVTITRVNNGWTVDYQDPIICLNTATKVFLNWDELVEFIGNRTEAPPVEYSKYVGETCPDCGECRLSTQELFEHGKRGCTRPVPPMDLEKHYPNWTCHECAIFAHGKMPANHVATFHKGHCDVCGLWKEVTEPRDYGHPQYLSYCK